MKKTAKTRPARHLPLSPAASLTESDLKELIGLIESTTAIYYVAGHNEPDDKRYLAKLERIKAKLRRGF